jgi:hypothetical protein
MRPAVERLGDGGVDLPGVAHVARHRQRLRPVPAHLGRHRLQGVGAAAARHHVGPDLAQLDGDGAPDALAGAR